MITGSEKIDTVYRTVSLIQMKMASIMESGSGRTIFLIFISFAIMPLLGVASGISLISMETWARKFTIISSIASIGLYVPLEALLTAEPYGFELIFLSAYLFALPIWSLYYFTRPHIKVLFSPNMKKPSLIHITAILMVGASLYSIFSPLGFLLSYPTGLSGTYKSLLSIYILILIVFSVCAIVAGAGLYFYKAWSRWLAMGIAASIFFVCLLEFLVDVSGGNLFISRIENISYTLFAIWCLYYLNRSDIEKKFRNTKTDTESNTMKEEDNIFPIPKGIKITAMLLIVVCGIQVVQLLIRNMAIGDPILGSGEGEGIVNFIFFMFNAITILLGLASGIGLISMKTWARKCAIIFSIVSIVLHVIDVASGTSKQSGFELVLSSTILFALPVWTLYYFTRPHIKVLLDPKNNKGNMKEPSWIHIITAVLMICASFYYLCQLGALSYAGHLSSWSSTTKLILTVFSVGGIVAGSGLYFYKIWSRWLAMGIAAFFFFGTLPMLARAFSGGNLSININDSINISYVLFAIWCLYYLNRSDIEEKFRNTKPDSESNSLKEEDILMRIRVIKIIAVLLIAICGIRFIEFFPNLMKLASIMWSGRGGLFFIIIFGAITPLLGLASGLGLIGMKTWARKFAIVFSIATIVRYVPMEAMTTVSNSGFELVINAYLCALSAWSLYFFTRTHIKVLFAQK